MKTDGTDESDGSASSSDSDSGTSSPVFENTDRVAATVSPFASRPGSPVAITGAGISDRVGSPISFGYPYHHNARDGYLSESAAPTAIQG